MPIYYYWVKDIFRVVYASPLGDVLGIWMRARPQHPKSETGAHGQRNAARKSVQSSITVS